MLGTWAALTSIGPWPYALRAAAIRHRRSETRSHGRSFLALLFLSSLTGLLLLALRETGAMGWLLAIHLGVVLGLFLTLPYGKFVHGIYRSAALVRSALEAARR